MTADGIKRIRGFREFSCPVQPPPWFESVNEKKKQLWSYQLQCTPSEVTCSTVVASSCVPSRF